jgi:peptidoglycan lytic transglycosylase
MVAGESPPFRRHRRHGDICSVTRTLIIAVLLMARPLAAQSTLLGDSEHLVARSGPDSVLLAAQLALDRGLPWRASQMLEPIVRDSVRRAPDAILLAANAAARWGGWSQVQRLVASVAWKGTPAAGSADLLASRAAVELGSDSLAAAQARAAAKELADPLRRAEAMIVLGRALDRLGQSDSAAVVYDSAAALAQQVGDWLRLRGASLTADSAQRGHRLAPIRLPAALDRFAVTEAVAREKAGDLLGAAALYRSMGNPVAALRLQLAARSDVETRDSVRQALLLLLGQQSPAIVRGAVALLDSALAPLTSEQELAVARAVGPAGVPSRAVAGFERAFKAELGNAQDRFDYAGSLFKLGKYADAAKVYARVPAHDKKLGGAAAYQRARSLLRDGQLESARKAFKAVAHKFSRDTAAAPPALWLLADLAADDEHDTDARKLYRELSKRFPESRFAPGARFQAALITLLQGDASGAGLAFDSLADSPRAGDEGRAARYWAGRAWDRANDSLRARSRWSALVERDPTSYYAGLSERRLGLATWTPPTAPDSFASVPSVDSAVDRARLLARLGLPDEAGWEYDRIVRDAGRSVEGLLATADALRSAGYAYQGMRLARRALAAGVPADARLYRLLYPVVQRDALVAECAAQGLDPALVAALIRQESSFNPAATSSVGARGLMQVMPDLGRTVAGGLGFSEWDPVLLWQPDVSISIGTVHLKDLVARYTDQTRILAAYNGGISRVDRWDDKLGVEDPEVFAERIPFVETRDYVRIIQRSRDLYRVLYDWRAGP